MAKAPKKETQSEGVKARVLVDCEYGSVNAVVVLSEIEAQAAEHAGLVDTHESAVAYAESLT